MIALIFQFGPMLFQLGLLLVAGIMLLLLVDKVKPGYRAFARLGVFALGVLVAWALLRQHEADKRFAWEQEVRFSDGRSIWIRRQTTFAHYGETTQVSSPRSLLEEFSFIHPATGETVAWQGQFDLNPLLLDFDHGNTYLATQIKPGKHFAWGCPPHPYAFFRYVDGKWQRIGIRSFPIRFVRSNVFPYLDAATRTTMKSGVPKLFADAVSDRFKPPFASDVRVIDRRIVNPLFFCRGSVDAAYEHGTTARLQNRFGTNPALDILTEQEAIAFGILKQGDEK